MRLLIVIPARFASTRLPGKPLREIAGVPMLARTVANARRAKTVLEQSGVTASIYVATDDERIEDFCRAQSIPCVMTDSALKTGSDRALAATEVLDPDASRFDKVLNLQGDAPFTPAAHLIAVTKTLIDSSADAATAYVQLDWDALNALREHKARAPFSGTTLIEDANGRAVWFSKTITPAIRNEEACRSESHLSPVKRHIGLYAYKRETLSQFSQMAESHYERLEGLEQLRLLEAGLSMACARVEPPTISLGGIDTEADIELAEALIAQHGDPHETGNS